jgi:hypothetical protein
MVAVIMSVIAAAIDGHPNVGAAVIARAVIVRTIITGTACVISRRGATGQQEGDQGQGKKN